MTTSLSVNKKLYALLKNDTQLKALVGDNVFPLVAEESVTFPFVLFGKDSCYPNYSKCGRVNDTASVYVLCVARDYSKTVDIAERIRALLELHHDSYFQRIEFSGVSEEFTNEVYVQKLNFKCII